MVAGAVKELEELVDLLKGLDDVLQTLLGQGRG